ncbi:hypothetical protein D6827_04085 [Candidatus Parcubacteria bacterium]|nr:MAG: hypothetical protein D6827_04085 [Candidatus Parcubacteria bacterium]
MKMKNKSVKIWKVIIIIVPIFIFLRLLWLNWSPFGELVIYKTVDDLSPFINDVLPDYRTLGVQYNNEGDAYQTIVDEPVYFTVNLPRQNFDSVEIELEFLNNSQKIIELGGLVDIYGPSYKLEPVQNLILDNLNWHQSTEGDVKFWQRTPNYFSLDDFLSSPPDFSEIAVYNYDLPIKFRLDNYVPRRQSQTFPVSLRGYHKYKTYIKNENFYLLLYYDDMNRTVGADSGAVRVWNEDGELILERKFSDDNNKTDNQLRYTGEILIDESDWPEGVYTVELVGTSDIFWRSITTKQQYMVFVNKIYLADNIGYSDNYNETAFYTDAKNFILETYHASSTQSVRFGSDSVAIPESHKKVYFSSSQNGILAGYTDKGDVKITGDGMFALSRESFFNPDPVKLTVNSDIDALGINYIIANYRGVDNEDGWQRAGAEFLLADLYKNEDRAIKFIISLPMLAQYQNTVDLHAIKIIFKKTPWTWRSIWNKVQNKLKNI